MASKRGKRRRACGDKVKHKTANAARFAMKAIKVKTGDYARTSVYPCKFCGGWHWGHSGRGKI